MSVLNNLWTGNFTISMAVIVTAIPVGASVVTFTVCGIICIAGYALKICYDNYTQRHASFRGNTRVQQNPVIQGRKSGLI